MERILIYAPNWLGDAVMALPAIADVRRAFPRASMTVAARPPVAPLFSLVRDVDETIVLRRDRPAEYAASERRQGGFDLALVLPNSFHAALLARRAGARERWGYRGDWRRALLTRSAPRPHGVHQVVFYQKLVAAFGIANGASIPSIELKPATLASGEQRLREAAWDGTAPLVGIAPGAAYGGAKRWPPEQFAAFIRRVAFDGFRTVIFGSAADEATGREIEQQAGAGSVINLIGRTSLPELAGAFGHCRVVVSNDSGAMHLAAAVGAPLIALFGPTREKETAPPGALVLSDGIPLPGESAMAGEAPTARPAPNGQRPAPSAQRPAPIVLVHHVWCRPCMLRECPLDHGCMRGISSERAYQAVSTIVGSGTQHPTPHTGHSAPNTRQSAPAPSPQHPEPAPGTQHPAPGTLQC